MSETRHEQQERPPLNTPGQMASLLNEGQRRSLTTVLRRLERAAWQLEEQVTREEQPDLALTTFTHAPSTLQQDLLVRLARCVRQEVASLAEDYSIEREEEDMSKTLHALFTLLWVDLEDARPQKLRHYGTLHPQLVDVLGPRIQEVIELVLAIDSVVKGTYESGQVQDLVNQ